VSLICLPRAFAIVAAGNPVNFIVLLHVAAAVVVVVVANRLVRHVVPKNIAEIVHIILLTYLHG